jgi:ligand-binding sensor domain-containing protein/signal transduction histidine kinase
LNQSFRNPVWRRVILGIGLAMLAGTLSAGQVRVVPEYRVSQWTVEDGLPQSSVQRIAQTTDGYLWLGTLFGLARFDGVKFKVFDLGNTPAMQGVDADGSIEALAAGAGGTLWIGTSGGLLRWQDHDFTLFTNGLRALEVRGLCVARDGTVWVGHPRGLSRMSHGVISPVTNTPLFDLPSTSHILETRDGAIWFGTTRSLVRRDSASGQFAEFSLPETPDITVLSLYEDRRSRLWVSVQQRRELFCIESNQVRAVRYEVGDPAQNRHLGANTIVEDRWGELWLSIRLGGGIYRMTDDERFVPFKDERGLIVPEAICSLEDQEGNLWLGTRTDGLLRLQRRRVQTLLHEDSPRFNIAWSVSEGLDGTIWVGTDGGAWRVRGDRVDVLPLSNRSDSVVASRAGSVWTGVREAGLTRWDPEQLVPKLVAPLTGLPSRVSAIYEDRAGTMWLGTENGLLRRGNQGELKPFGQEQGLNSRDVRAVLEDSRGTLWVATMGQGLFWRTNDQFHQFGMAEGLSHNNAWVLHEDASGAIWAGTEHGLNRIKDGKCFVFATTNGLFNSTINHLLEDGAGNFWISCNRGIFYVAKSDLDAVADGRKSRVQSHDIGERDGMLTGETNGERQPAGCRSRDGRLWFPTPRGVVVFDPARIIAERKAQQESPHVVIEQVAMGENRMLLGDGHPAKQPVELPPGWAGILQIDYTANSFSAPAGICFRYRLLPMESNWFEARGRRTALYHNLSPGSYRFEVLACNPGGEWATTPATFDITLPPLFWQTTWFKALCLAAVILLGVSALLRYDQLQRRKARAVQERAIETERMRISQNIHDELGSSLASISILSDLAGKDAALPESSRPHLARIAGGTRELIARLSELVWSTSPRNDPIEQAVDHFLTHAKDFLEPAGVRCRFDVPDVLPRQLLRSESRHHLFLAFKETLNNVWRHAGASEVWIRVRFDKNELTLIVEDNGCGFDPATPVSGHGRENLQARMKSARGRCQFESAPGRGTCVRLVVPIV